MVRRLAAAALVLGGCFSPSFDNLRCDPDGDCPAGYTCVAGHCRAGEGPDAAPGPFVVSTSPTDGATDGEPTAAITATFSVPMDPATISDRAEFGNPHQYAVGVSYVIVNGQLVLDGGSMTEARPGAALYGAGRKSR